jgi:hypothetical protein
LVDTVANENSKRMQMLTGGQMPKEDTNSILKNSSMNAGTLTSQVKGLHGIIANTHDKPSMIAASSTVDSMMVVGVIKPC